MARKTNTTTNTNSRTNNPADAFLRLEVIDSKGNAHRLPRDVALYMSTFMGEQLIKATEADAEKTFELRGSVHIVDNSPKEDLAL